MLVGRGGLIPVSARVSWLTRFNSGLVQGSSHVSKSLFRSAIPALEWKARPGARKTTRLNGRIGPGNLMDGAKPKRAPNPPWSLVFSPVCFGRGRGLGNGTH